MTFISKNADLNYNSRYNISNDSNIQMLNILSNIENFMIFIINDEKSPDKNRKYTIKRKITSTDISKKASICEGFNAHYL